PRGAARRDGQHRARHRARAHARAPRRVLRGARGRPAPPRRLTRALTGWQHGALPAPDTVQLQAFSAVMAPTPAIREDTVTLPDGRRLAWSAGGPGDGVPVIYLHGAIGTSVRRT